MAACPVAFRTLGRGRVVRWEADPARNLETVDIAVKEWIGLVAYWATGRIDSLFPGPDDVGETKFREPPPGGPA